MQQALHLVARPEWGPVRVVLAGGNELTRALLARAAGIVIASEATTADDAVAAAAALRPDVVVVEAGLPGVDGAEIARRITTEPASAGARVLALVAGGDEEAALAALRAGATGALRREAGPGELVEAVRAVARGETLLAPSVAGRMIADFLARPERLRARPEGLHELTAREREVVTLVGRGLSNQEIAERLVVTHATAKTHVSRALGKLGARDRAQLAVLAHESGLVRRGPQPVAA